jgi:hypothetical protein
VLKNGAKRCRRGPGEIPGVAVGRRLEERLCERRVRAHAGVVQRLLRPELLDALPPDSPEALRSRRDLVRLNRLMGNHAWFLRRVPALARDGERALEIGAGDGALALALGEAGVPTDALDRFPAPAAWPSATRWHQADLRAYAGRGGHALVVGNLILHHLDAGELQPLGARLDRHARVLVFNEPRRSFRSLALWAIGAPLGGAGRVTRHDGRVSIRAGFRGEELPRALGLSRERWAWWIETTCLGAYRLVATRRS